MYSLILSDLSKTLKCIKKFDAKISKLPDLSKMNIISDLEC